MNWNSISMSSLHLVWSLGCLYNGRRGSAAGSPGIQPPCLGLQQCDSPSDLEREGGLPNVLAVPLIWAAKRAVLCPRYFASSVSFPELHLCRTHKLRIKSLGQELHRLMLTLPIHHPHPVPKAHVWNPEGLRRCTYTPLFMGNLCYTETLAALTHTAEGRGIWGQLRALKQFSTPWPWINIL